MKSLIRLSTRRRVTIAMGAVTLLLFGAIALFSDLKVNLLPDLSYPTLTVRTEYPGAAPAEIENLVTEPVEEALGVVKNVLRVESVSRTGQSDVLLHFAWGTDMDFAGLDVREKLEVLQLPVEVSRPSLLRFDPSTDPVMRMAFAYDDAGRNDEESLKRLRRYAEEQLQKLLEPVPGVAAVKISGGLDDEIQINVDQQRLSTLGLTREQVIDRLRSENVNLSGGRLEEGTQRYLVRTVNQFASVEEIANTIVSTDFSGRPVYLRDVAEVRRGYKEREAIIRSNGQEAVELAVYKEGDGNTVQVAEAVRERMQEIEEQHPEGTSLRVIDDQSVFIDQSISDVGSAALFGGLLAILVLYLFLGEAWSTVIISVAIPISIMATFFLMGQAGIGLNIMSLGGIALATGLLVDNAIVVLENIARYREAGKAADEAAVLGTSEVGSAVVASTLTTVAVFFPLVFVEGVAGQLFRDQALTVTFALLVSLLAALTLIPMLSSLKKRSSESFADETLPPRMRPRTRFGRGAQRTRLFIFDSLIAFILTVLAHIYAFFGLVLFIVLWPFKKAILFLYGVLAAGYDRLLPWALNHRLIVMLVAAGLMAGSVALVPRLGAELIPEFAQGRFEIDFRLPPGTPLDQTDEAIRQVGLVAAETEGVDLAYAVAGSGNRLDANPTEAGENTGNMLVMLSDPAREPAVIDRLRSFTEQVPSMDAKYARPELLSFETPLEIEIIGYDLEQLKASADRVATALGASDRFSDVKSSLEEGHPEIQIVFDQERAARLGLSVKQLSDQVVRQVRGEIATRYSWRDRKIDVLVRAEEEDRSSLADIRDLIVNPGSERPVTLASVADVTVTEGAAEIRRLNQERAALVSANLAYGDLAAAVEEAEALLDSVPLARGQSLNVAGQSEEMEASFNSLMFALGLAIFLVYLVMASQFESLLHPFVILFSVPLALIGAVLALYLTGTSISVVVFIGLIMLAGIVVNNAIVLVDRVNQLRAEGMERLEAIVAGASARLRPIIMTTLTTVAGLSIMAFSGGEGSEIRAPMAITVIGGLLVSTLLTLVVIPVMYSLLDRKKMLASSASEEGGRLVHDRS